MSSSAIEARPSGRTPAPPLLVRLVIAAVFAFTAVWAGASDKPVFVHYMPWFVAKPHSPEWGHHWTMGSCDPDQTLETGRRQIAAHLYPAIGPYDSADPVVLEYHVLLMKLAGIDGVIVDWYGKEDVHDYAINEERTRAIRDAARGAGLQFCLCYEDRTIPAAIDTGRITSEAAIAHGQEALRYAESNYFRQAGYLRLSNGRPVLLNFGPQYLREPRQWLALFSVLDHTNRPALFTLNDRLAVGEGAFNWPPMHLSKTNGGILSRQVLADHLEAFERSAAPWPAFISSAFPQFHDYYQQAGLHASYGRLDGADGAVFRDTLARALTNDSVLVQLVTWNDFGEGTAIEPTVEFGYRHLGVVQDLRREHLDPGFGNTTNDLELASRYYHLRREHVTDPAVNPELDRVFAAIVSGDLRLAALRLDAIEATRQAHSEGACSRHRAEGQSTSKQTVSRTRQESRSPGTNPLHQAVPIAERHPPDDLGVSGSTR